MSKLWNWVKNHRTAVIAVIFWVALLVGARQYMSANNLTFAQLTRQLQDGLTGEWWGALLYVAIYLIRPLILFPASLLTILGGSVYGLPLGFVLVLLTGTASATVPYVVGRWFSTGEAVKEEAVEEGGSALKRFVAVLRRNPFQAVLTARLLFLPYDAVSLIAGNLRISFLTFFLATALGNVVGTFAYVGIGASIQGDITTGDVSLDWRILAASLAVLVISLVASRYFKARQARKEAAVETEGTREALEQA